MSLLGLLDLGRSDRFSVERAGTVRDEAHVPFDVVVENLSTTGCLFSVDRTLPLGMLVSIGLPGVGVRYARISRIDGPRYACAFLSPVSIDNVAAALSTDTMVTDLFPQSPPPSGSVVSHLMASSQSFEPKWPVGKRIIFIVGLSAISWAAIIAGMVAIAR